MPSSWTLLIVVLFVAAALWAFRAIAARRRARALLVPEAPEPVAITTADRGLMRWLHLAGLRHRDIQRRWLVAELVAIVVGLVSALTLAGTQAVDWLVTWSYEVPGGFGQLFLPILFLAPWIVFLIIASMPVMWVRAHRRRRVAQIEVDLPMMLELLATLAEAGLGFDAALERVLGSLPPERSLARELRGFQQEVLAGVPRWEAFRRLAGRVDVASVSIFVSALVQAEQIGAGLSETLRSQAADVWNRRRERALMQAQSLPAKLAFPLVTCFLPALFVITLGPILLDFIELAEGVLGQTAR